MLFFFCQFISIFFLDIAEEKIVQWHQKFLNGDQFAWESAFNFCSERSEKMSQRLEAAGIVNNKIFCFGDQESDPLYEFDNGGIISWGYHTAPTVNTKDGIIIVIDSAVNSRPLLRDTWLEKLIVEKQRKLLIHQEMFST